jgi:hypothetical protein
MYIRLFCFFLLAPTAASGMEGQWQNTGLIRVRDLTPFGISRLDFLPAHAFDAPPGSFAIETNVAYQNTYLMSEAVAELLAARGPGRAPISSEDAAAILALPGDAVFVDGELALLDLTVHYAIGERTSAYLTIPTFTFQGGFLDSSIEGFHEEFGFSTAGRDLVERNNFQVIYDVAGQPLVLLDPPDDYSLGDPVLGLRWSAGPGDGLRFVFEVAVKPAWSSEQTIVSTGRTDYGLQATLQKKFPKSAFYLAASIVDFGGASLLPGVADSIIPTAIVGWERRVTRHTNFVAQFYASPSIVQDTTLEELTKDKYQATFGLVSRRGRHAWSFALTENVSNFENTPDIGINLGYAYILRERR